MSTKTLRKRIALVAVSALGFGLVSVVPASAAPFPSVTITTTDTVLYTDEGTAVTTTFLVNAAANTANGDNAATLTLANSIKPAQASAQSGNTTTSTANSFTFTNAGTLGSPYVTSTASTKIAVAVASATSYTLTPDSTGTTATSASAVGAKIAGTVSFTPSSPGKYVYTITPSLGTAATVTVYVSDDATSLTATSAVQASVSQSILRADLDSVTINASRPAGGTSADGALLYRVLVSEDADLVAGSVISASGTPVGATIGAASGTNGSLVLANNLVNTVGTYTIRAFVDANGSGAFDSTESYADTTFIMAGVPDVTAVAMDRSDVLEGGSGVYGYATVSITDEDGNPTYVYDETFTNTVTVAAVASSDASWSTAVAAGNRIGTTNKYTGVVRLYTGLAASPAATYSFKSAISGGTTAGSASIIVRDSGSATLDATDPIKMTTVAGLYTGTLGAATYSTAIPSDARTATGSLTRVGVKSDIAVTTHTYTVKGTAAKTYAVTLTVAAGTPLADFTAPTRVTTLADGTAVFTVVNATPADTDAYTIDVTDGTNTSGYSITYAELAGAWSMSPTAASNAKVLKATTNKVTATLTDNFGRVLANTAYSVSVSGRNVTAASGTTDATGTATYTITDTATTSYTTYPSDTVTFTSVGTTTVAAGTGAVTFTYVETLAAVSTVTVTNPASASYAIDQVEAVAGAAANRATWTATVRLATGAVAGSGVLVTFAADADTIFYKGINTAVTDANGQATAIAFKRKAGNIVMSATANGVTGSALTPVAYTNTDGSGSPLQSASARNVAVSPAQSIVGGSVATVVATVTDRWGNPVNNVGVTFVLTGVGRLNTGSALSAATNAAGIAQVQVTAAGAEVGTMNIVAAIGTGNGQVSDIAGRVAGSIAGDATTAKAGNYTAATSVSFTKDTSTSTADALLALAQALGTKDQASAAVDAAAEATDAANAATDAANAAAEAADAATAAAQDAADAVAALSTQVSEMVAALKKQITSLTNLVIKIQKKVKA